MLWFRILTLAQIEKNTKRTIRRQREGACPERLVSDCSRHAASEHLNAPPLQRTASGPSHPQGRRPLEWVGVGSVHSVPHPDGGRNGLGPHEMESPLEK